MAEEIAKFRFIKYQILKSCISISNVSDIGKEIDVEITRTDGFNEGLNIFKLVLGLNIKDKNSAMDINVDTEGYFEFDKDLTEDEKDMFFNINAPAILFPYVRAYITALTALSGVPPIILPTINLSARKKDE